MAQKAFGAFASLLFRSGPPCAGRDVYLTSCWSSVRQDGRPAILWGATKELCSSPVPSMTELKVALIVLSMDGWTVVGGMAGVGYF